MFEQRPSGLYVPGASSREVIAPELEQLLERERRAGELPPLAGGAGSWILTIPETVLISNAGEVGPALEQQGQTSNLLTLDRPTIMTEWVLTSINLFISAAALGEATGATLTVLAQLVIGGDIVWTGGLERPAALSAVNTILTFFRIAADFNNPITLPAGRSLQLRITFSSSVKTKEITVTLKQSTVAYNVRQLTGHRTL